MKTIVIQLKDDADVRLISSMLKKMRIHFKVFKTDDNQDVELGEMMLKVDRTEKVSRAQVMQKLGEE